MTFGERVKYVREKRGMSLQALARATGINPGYLVRIEQGKHRKTPIETAKLLARALGVTLDYLAGMYENEGQTDIGE